VTPELLEQLRQQLPPFGAGVTPSPGLRAFCRFYGIDFAAQCPAVEHRAGTVHSGSYTLAVHAWCQPDAQANLLLLHGYFDHTGLFNKLIAWALAHKCNVLIFDLPGHGLSTGEPAAINAFAEYSRAIADVLAAVEMPSLRWWVMAQSTGGAALIDFARHARWPFTATVLLAPLVRPVGWLRVSLGHRLLGSWLDSVPRKFAVNSSDKAFLTFLQRDPLQSKRISLRWVAALRHWLQELPHSDLGVGPALVVQGDADATVDWRYNLPVIQALFPGSEIAMLPGAGHQLANESAEFRSAYLTRVQTWLAQNGITLPGDPQG
jgi:lysophospholipase